MVEASQPLSNPREKHLSMTWPNRSKTRENNGGITELMQQGEGGLFSAVVSRGMRTSETCDDSRCMKLSKLLINVTFQRSVGVVHVVISPEKTVRDLISAAVEIYVRDKRRPLLAEPVDTLSFELHYSQFTLECLNPDQKLINLASRNCFLCPKASTSSFNEGRKINSRADSSFSLTKLLDYML